MKIYSSSFLTGSKLEEALFKLHRETVNNLRWHSDIGRIDERQAEKTKEIWHQMKTFADWIREIQWLME